MADAAKTRSKTPFHLLAGLGSGMLSAVLLQPIDLLKTRVQQAGHHSLRQVLADLRQTAQAAIPATPASAGTISATLGARATTSSAPWRTNIIASLYRGTVPSVLRTGLGSALYFAGLNAMRSSAATIPGLQAKAASVSTAAAPSSSALVPLSNAGNLLAGAVARAVAGFVLMPLTILKVRYESSLYAYGSLAAAARDIARTEGLRGFFAGFGATALRDAPYAGLYVLLYEQSKRHLDALATGFAPPALHFTSALLAAAACSAVSNPFDAVKTRIQLQPARYRHLLHAARRMLAEDGLRSFWDGLALRMSRKAMSSALAWTVYEELIRRAEMRWAESSRHVT